MIKICPEGSLKPDAQMEIWRVSIEWGTPICIPGYWEDKTSHGAIVHEWGCYPSGPTTKKCHILYSLREPLKKLLEQGVEQIYEKVPEGEAITRCSLLVVQPKPRHVDVKRPGAQHDTACIDLRVQNKFMKRSRITQGATIEDIAYVMCSVNHLVSTNLLFKFNSKGISFSLYAV